MIDRQYDSPGLIYENFNLSNFKLHRHFFLFSYQEIWKSVDGATLLLLLCIKALTQPRIRWILISRRNIPLLHLCETWQTGSFPRLHSFDELFKSQSRDSFCLVTVKTCHWKWGVLSQTVFALFYRFTIAPSKGLRMPPFNHVHVLSETVNWVKRVTWLNKYTNNW